jgi:hypothetical protein
MKRAKKQKREGFREWESVSDRLSSSGTFASSVVSRVRTQEDILRLAGEIILRVTVPNMTRRAPCVEMHHAATCSRMAGCIVACTFSTMWLLGSFLKKIHSDSTQRVSFFCAIWAKVGRLIRSNDNNACDC